MRAPRGACAQPLHRTRVRVYRAAPACRSRPVYRQNAVFASLRAPSRAASLRRCRRRSVGARACPGVRLKPAPGRAYIRAMEDGGRPSGSQLQRKAGNFVAGVVEWVCRRVAPRGCAGHVARRAGSARAPRRGWLRGAAHASPERAAGAASRAACHPAPLSRCRPAGAAPQSRRCRRFCALHPLTRRNLFSRAQRAGHDLRVRPRRRARGRVPA